MALPKLFQRIFWHNNTTPAINEDNLNAMSKGLSDVDDRVIGLAGTIMEDVPQIQEDIEELEADMALIDTKIASATAEANRATTAANNAAASVISAGNKALVSEGWAKGTQNGAAVGSTSPYYHNNAEYFKNQARSFTPQGYQDLVDDVDSLKETLTDFEESITGEVVDSEPYVLRQGLGNLADMSLVGGSIAWNQLVSYAGVASRTLYDVTFTNNLNGSFTVNGTASENAIYEINTLNPSITAEHVYYLAGCPSNGANDTYRLDCRKTGGVVAEEYGNGKIFKPDESISVYFAIRIQKNFTVSNKVFKPQFIDLTQMFGSTIADYIYSLEQATAGAGVAWFRKYFRKNYYANNAGTLMNVNVKSRKAVGFNAFDEVLTLGDIHGDTGADITSSEYLRSNYISVLAGRDYYFRSSTTIRKWGYFYDADKQYLGSDSRIRGNTNTIFAVPNNAKYIRFLINVSEYGALVYKNDICINISKATGSPKNGDYVPYSGTEYPFDTSVQLRGIPKLVDNKLSYDGDIYTADGTVTRKYGIVDLGSLNWAVYSGVFYTAALTTAKQASGITCICSKYKAISNVTGTEGFSEDKTCAFLNNTSSYRFYVKDSDYSDADAFKTAMSGVYLVYELATPTTELATPFQNPQRAFIDGTEEFVDYGVQSATRDVSIPVGNNTTYQLNETLPPTEDYVDGALKFKAAISVLGTDESGRTTASRAYTAGEFFYKDGKMYKVLTSIAQGATFTINTNCQQTTLFAELKALAQ